MPGKEPRLKRVSLDKKDEPSTFVLGLLEEGGEESLSEE